MPPSSSTQPRHKLRDALLELAHHLAHLANRHGEQRIVKMEAEESVSPICRVPEDILHHIFEFCLSDNNLTIDDPHHPTVVLSHVCRPWRELMLSYSPYWSDIRIVTPPSPICQKSHEEVEEEDHHRDEEAWKAKMQRVTEAARTFIARSNECPLTITFHKESCDSSIREYGAYDVCRNTYSSLMEVLCSASKRWNKCFFELVHCDCIRDALESIIELTHDDVPTLDSLTWRAVDLVSLRKATGILLSSSLKKLHLLDADVNRPWSGLLVNWASLTELYYEGFVDYEYIATEGRYGDRCFGPRSALALLKLCPSLVTCRLAISSNGDAFQSLPYHDFPDENINSPVELVHLRSLTLEGYILARELCDLLCLPAVQELHLLEGNTLLDGDKTTPECIFPWIEKYGGIVVSLEVVLKNLSIEETLKLLTRVPGVRSLKIRIRRGPHDGKRLAAAVLESLTPRLDESDSGGLTAKMGCLCPSLRKFAFSQNTDAFRERDVVPFIKGRRSDVLRRHGVSIIEDVELGFVCGRGEDVRALLVEEGVDVKGLSLEAEYEGYYNDDEDASYDGDGI